MEKNHKNIRFFNAPIVWIKDKYFTIFNQPKIYIIAAIPSIFAAIGLIADFSALLKIECDSLLILLLCFLFVFGLVNLVFVTIIQRTSVRLNRQKSSTIFLHTDLIETIKEYQTLKMYKFSKEKDLKKREILECILNLLIAFHTFFLSKYYRKNIAISVKYLFEEKVYSIRYGGNHNKRDNNPELVEESYIFNILSNSGNKLDYLYVKNIRGMDSIEENFVRSYKDNIFRRALNKYETYLAFPLRSGKLLARSKYNWISRPDTGLVGFDYTVPYSFGNLHEDELHIFASLADIICEPVADLIGILKEEKKHVKQIS